MAGERPAGGRCAREFYKEREVVIAERRMRTDSESNRPAHRTASGHSLRGAHYGRSGIGWPSEVSQINAPRRWSSTRSITWGEHCDRRGGRT